MKEQVEKLIKELEADVDARTKGKARGQIAPSVVFRGSALSALKGARDNLIWAESAEKAEAARATPQDSSAAPASESTKPGAAKA